MTLPPAVVIERVARIASASAAQALSELVGQRVTSETALADDGAADDASETVRTRFDVQGYGRSAFLASFRAESLRSVQEALAPGMGDSAEARDMVAREVGNICVSHFLNSLGDMIHAPLLPGPPAAGDPPVATAGEFVIHTDFRAASGGRIHGTLRFLPDARLVEAIRRAQESA